jgi:hypothetical protein
MIQLAAFLVSEDEDADEPPRHPPLLPGGADELEDVDLEAAVAKFNRPSLVTTSHTVIGDDLSRYPTPKDPHLLIVRCGVSSSSFPSSLALITPIAWYRTSGNIRTNGGPTGS